VKASYYWTQIMKHIASLHWAMYSAICM